MTTVIITTLDNSPALPLPDEVLQSSGLSIGDELEVKVENGVIILDPVAGEERRQKLETFVGDVFQRRKDAYERPAHVSRAVAYVPDKNAELYRRLAGESR